MAQVRVTYPAITRDELIERLRELSKELQKALPLTRVILFGSYASNRYTAASDIDLIVVYEDPERHEAYATVANRLRLPRLEPRVYTESQYQALLKESQKFSKTIATESVTILGEAKTVG